MIQKKICLLGPTGVGKTSLVKQFVEGIFSEKYLTSIGVKIDKKQIQTSEHMVQLMIWDLEGTDRYCGFQAKYLRGASAYIIVTDQTRSQSLLEGIEIHKMVKAETNIPGVLVFNKSDMPCSWHWSDKEVDESKQYFEHACHTSAKTGDGVDAMFSHVAQLVSE